MTTPLDPHAGQPVVTTGAPLGTARGAVVVLHGRNAGPENMLELVTRLNRPDVTYLAPTAAARSWYPLSFLAPSAHNEPWLGSALKAIDGVLDVVADRGVPPERTVLLGFSQGACLGSEYVWQSPARCHGLIAFSGGLIGPPGTAWSRSAAPGVRAFFGCSDVDAHVPWSRVQESADAFTRMGATVDVRQYPGMGHLVCDDEISAAQALIDRVAR